MTKPQSLKLMYIDALSFLTIVGFSLLALGVQKKWTTSFDGNVTVFVQGWESPGWTRLMQGLTWLGSTVPTAVISVLALLLFFTVFGHRKQLLLFASVVVGSTAIGYILKSLFGRERPDLYRLSEVTGFSFPSSSSVAAIALYGVIVYAVWGHLRSRMVKFTVATAAILLVLCIGVSRIYMGHHYPSDVLGGILAGAAWLLLMIGVFKRWMN
ncbi:phosphatase PAP2 family protein [Paenibacillus sp. CAU 1782]